MTHFFIVEDYSNKNSVTTLFTIQANSEEEAKTKFSKYIGKAIIDKSYDKLCKIFENNDIYITYAGTEIINL